MCLSHYKYFALRNALLATQLLQKRFEIKNSRNWNEPE